MRLNVFHRGGISITVLTLCIAACDTFPEKDHLKPDLYTYYTLPNSSVLVDLPALGSHLPTSAVLRVASGPSNGKIIPVDGRLIRYQPDWDFKEGEDSFVVIAKENNKLLDKFTLRVKVVTKESSLPCRYIPLENRQRVDGPGSVSIPILDDDHLCGTDKSSLSVSIYSQPSQGQATVEGQSIRYTVDHSLQLKDEMIYEVRTPDGSSSFGLVSLAKWTMEVFAAPIDDYLRGDLVFVDEMTGFCSGTLGVFKTKNGGASWYKVTPSTMPGGYYGNIVDLEFFNAQEGIALYSGSNHYSEIDSGVGLLKTVDGGEHWKEFPIPGQGFASSVFFISSTRGFVGLGLLDDEGQLRYTMLGTDDGGRTWRKVVSGGIIETYPFGVWDGGGYEISFANEQVGYAYAAAKSSVAQDTVLVTEDGGESWTPIISAQAIAVIASDSDGLLASLATDHRYSRPSSLVKFQGSNSIGQELVRAPYRISQLGFSPSGLLGFAGGTTRDVVLGLYKSTDGGLTWSAETLDAVNGGGVESQGQTNMRAITVPSENTVYVLYGSKIVKYTNR